MKLRSLLIAATTVVFLPTVGQAQEASYASGAEGQPWISDPTIGRGAGIRTGEFVWHPGVSAEFGYDSNFYRRAGSVIEDVNLGPVQETLRFRVNPQLTLRLPESPARPIAFEIKGDVGYNDFISLDGPLTRSGSLRNLQGGAGGLLQIFPGRKWSGSLGGNYAYIFDPSNQGGFLGAYSRHVIGASADVTWRPGGGSFQWTLLRYDTRFTIFDEANLDVYDNANHNFTTSGSWKFLPKTALLFDGGLGILDYGRPTRNNGENLKGRIGFNGLLTKHLGLMAMGGWATSFFHNDNGLVRNYDGFIGQAEAKWHFNAGTRLQEGSGNVGLSAVALGYNRSYEQSYLSDFFLRDRGYAQASYFFGGRVITTLNAGVSRINYPEFLFAGQVTPGFGETRIDVNGFVEYRFLETVGVNLTATYDQNISEVLVSPQLTDDLSFNRFRGFLGVRWFM